MSLTDRQRRAVDALSGVAIVAGAGTGKTHTVGHRYLAHLEAGLSPLSIVAVTFTERAAHELRARVRAYAGERLDRHDPRLAELEAATIGTVHALCLRICRDHPEAAGVPPDVRILDPLEGTVWTAERLESALQRLPPELFDALPYERVRELLAALLDDPWQAERALGHGPESWPARVEEARREAFAAWLASPAAVAARTTLAGLSGPPADAGDAGEAARAAVLAAFDAAEAGDEDRVSELLHGRRPNVGARKAWGGDQDTLRGALGVALGALRGWRHDPLATLRLGPADETLAALLPEIRAGFAAARAELDAAKRRQAVLDFADVEVGALRALQRPEVVSHYRERWSVLLVDEVQDTSPVQEAILSVLSGFCTTTLVGDAKQAIYGFRGADAAVFRRMTDRVVAGGGEAVVLDRSFRTHQPLVDAGNRTFEVMLGPDHEPLGSAIAQAPQAEPSLRRWTLEAPKGTPTGVLRLAEAHRIADEILDRLAAATPVRDDGAEGGTRPLRPGDVAVLARTWAPLDLLAEILPARGVPAVHTGGGDLLATREAQDGMAALRFLADPNDDVALVALLRGPCFSASDADLEAFAQSSLVVPDGGDRRPPWWSALSELRPRWAVPAVDVLDELRRAAAYEPPGRLLQLLDRATGWSAVVANLPGGPRRLADLDGFADRVRELERAGRDVFGVVRRLRRLLRAGVEVERPALEAEDAVTLTTIHRSKGLEWPFVIVAALDARGRPGGERVRIDPEVGVGVRVEGEDDRNARPAIWTLLDARAQAAAAAEDRRLLYVALTRAADQVAVSDAGGGGPFVQIVAPALEAAGVATELVEVDPAEVGWPSPPLPRPGGLASSAADGPGPASVATPGEVASVDVASVDVAEELAWEAALWRVEAIAPEAADLLRRVRDAGVRAPAPVATVDDATWLARWVHGPTEIRLLEPGVRDGPGGDGPSGGSDGARSTVDVSPSDPEAAYRRLLGLLRAPAG
ncbi:MAG: UvrD-helicase domain-containing protein [Trueperaceae bacterium]|nr:UvrD-helicase domain-containing protein [Trueperaceae bacterium]